MHEFSVAGDILASARRKARELGAGRAWRLLVRVGDLSGFDPECLRFSLETLSREEAPAFEVAVSRARPVLLCPRCGEVECPGRFDTACPRCGGRIEGVKGGDDIEVALECDDDKASNAETAEGGGEGV
jgi:hydrogenase nickel incorporation protein HypA/HybF